MMEYLILHCGGYFSTSEWMKIRNKNGQLELDYYLFSREYPRERIPHFHAVWSKERSRRWLTKIEEIHLDEWDDKYWMNACDGTQWKVRYKHEEEPSREIFGSNAYPDNWDHFRKLTVEIARKLPRVEDVDIQDLFIAMESKTDRCP